MSNKYVIVDYTRIYIFMIEIGDMDLKDYVVPTPDVIQIELDGSEEFMVLATDGLWDEVDPDLCAQVVKEFLLRTGKTVTLEPKLHD